MMTKDKTVTMSRGLIREQFEYSVSDRAWFVAGGTAEDDTPEGFVYGDFTTDMCWTCYFEARQIAAPVVECQPAGYARSGNLRNLALVPLYGSIELDGIPRHKDSVPLYTSPLAPVAVPEKYDDVLLPFLALMRSELHANAHKGDRPGWLQMDSKTAILEVFYHMGKLHQAVHRGEETAIKEYAADVANMCMMLLDVCACLDKVKELNQC